jgi:glyoxylase-like metal-dependent hydrolase (beta-lactamase superfamily II)
MKARELGGGVGVVVAGNPGPLTLDGTRSYRIGKHRALLIDPGPDLPGQMERLAGLVGDATVEHVCLTHAHADHAGLAQVASNAFGARLAASEETLARLDLDGRVLQGGDRLEVDESSSQLHVVETPGHSADSLSFETHPPRPWRADLRGREGPRGVPSASSRSRGPDLGRDRRRCDVHRSDPPSGV